MNILDPGQNAADERKAADAAMRSCVVLVGADPVGLAVAGEIMGELGVAIESDATARGAGTGSFAAGVNRSLTAAVGAGPLLPADFEDRGERLTEIEDELAVLIGRRAGAGDPWGFADIGTAQCLPVYRRVFGRLGIAPKYVFCVRNPADLGLTGGSDDRVDADLAQLAWFTGALSVLVNSGLNCFVLHHEKLLEDPVSVARKLSRFVRDRVDCAPVEAETLLRIVGPALNRTASVLARPTNPVVGRLYHALRGCEGWSYGRADLRDTVSELAALHEAFARWARVAAREDALSDRAPGEDGDLEETCRALARENASLTAKMVDARCLCEEYQRRSVSAEDARAALEKELATVRRTLETSETHWQDKIASLKARGDGYKNKALRLEQEKRDRKAAAPVAEPASESVVEIAPETPRDAPEAEPAPAEPDRGGRGRWKVFQ